MEVMKCCFQKTAPAILEDTTESNNEKTPSQNEIDEQNDNLGSKEDADLAETSKQIRQLTTVDTDSENDYELNSQNKSNATGTSRKRISIVDSDSSDEDNTEAQVY